MARRKKRKSPARDRYERNNPVVSFRVKRKDKDRSTASRKELGMSHGDVYNAGLGIIEVKIRSEKELKLQGYDEGYEQAAKAAEELYMVTYPCSRCGKTIIVDGPEEKEAIKRYMAEHGWSHGDCQNP